MNTPLKPTCCFEICTQIMYSEYKYLRYVNSNLFVTTDTEGTHSVTSLGKDRLLAGELLQHLKKLKKENFLSSVSRSFVRDVFV